jgi:predicted dinucleotide-binding enzyme
MNDAPASERNAAGLPSVDAGMTTIGLIGSGNIGSTVARLAVGAGHDVVLSNSRGPETLQDLVTELGPHARAATAEEAAEAGDLVVVTIPFKNVRDVPVEPLRGKVVIDTCNYYPQRDGHVAELDDGSTTSSELVQAHLVGSKVVKAFNNIQSGHLGSLARPHGAPDRSVLAIAGDDAAAKATFTELLDTIGYDAYDAGPLAESWRFQPGAPAYGAPYNGDSSGVWPPPPGTERHVTADVMAEKLAEATRPSDSV